MNAAAASLMGSSGSWLSTDVDPMPGDPRATPEQVQAGSGKAQASNDSRSNT